MSARVQSQDFDAGAEIRALTGARTDVGAVCSFIGLVRDMPLTLEHYPAMTQASLSQIEATARDRFDLIDACLIHRFGALQPADQIVLVIAIARHRQAAFDGAAYMMDRLKTDAPFWKQEGDTWVRARESDKAAASRW